VEKKGNGEGQKKGPRDVERGAEEVYDVKKYPQLKSQGGKDEGRVNCLTALRTRFPKRSHKKKEERTQNSQ